ncbi:MAG: LPS export ABC transporter periplasmic protein LptC [Alphaproteobacteria bacterium]|nr:LPS export ABC transporter periplasmic protein LptC [Alphaproteobacteria bacterium]
MKSKRHFIISGRHRRLQRLWQFFFTGWGLVMLCALVAGAILNQNLMWTPIRSVNMADIMQNQFKMENLSFAGIDKNGHPFVLKSDVARQKYDHPDKIFMDAVTARIVRIVDGISITDDIKADSGVFDRAERTATLSGNVVIDSNNGDKLRTNELLIRL